MAVTKRFTEQIVVMTTPAQAAQIKEISEAYGVSVAQVARDAAGLGLPKLAAHYRSLGITKPETPAEDARHVGRERADIKSGASAMATGKGKLIRARRGSKLEVPAAVFSAPAE